MEYRDYYRIMGVARDATQEEIKRAYRRLARKYHPDVSKEADAEERFKEVGEAYEVLKDPEKRAAYDQLGADWKAGQEFRPPPDWDAGFEFSGGDFRDAFGAGGGGYSDFFETLFGRGFARHGFTPEGAQRGWQMHGSDHHAKVLIDLEDAMNGATRAISLRVPVVDAKGHVGTRERVLRVNIPRGVKQGQHIRLAGQGNPGIGEGKPGDLYLEIEFNPHSIYRVDGRDVYLDVPVTPWEAALGATIKIPTPGGKVDMKIRPGTQNGSKLRLKGRGIPGTPAGDLYVILNVALPPATSEQARQIYRDMQRELEFNPRAVLGV